MSRIRSVDALRTLAIIAVIVIHATPFELPTSPIGQTFDAAIVVNQMLRFAVPFFFVMAGYFWALKFTDDRQVIAPTLRVMWRIALIFVAWSAIYLLPALSPDMFDQGIHGPYRAVYWHLVTALNRPMFTLMEGTKGHLWFLMGLLCSLGITAVFLRFNGRIALIVLAVVLYVIGLAGKAYADTPLGFHADFNFRNGPFFSLIFFVTGYLLQRSGPDERWFRIGVCLATLGLVMHFAELVTLHEVWGTNMLQDYLLGTYFMGTGVALLALSQTRHLDCPAMASVGPLVLGIYASHQIFIDMLEPLEKKLSGHVAWDIPYAAAVFLLSLLLTRMLARWRLTRWLVA